MDSYNFMIHRHIDSHIFSAAAIDDIIARGYWDDWVALRNTALSDRSVLEKIEQICRMYISDPYAQRYHFWKNFVEVHREF